MQAPPAYAAIVLPPVVRLHHLSLPARQRIAAAGLHLEYHDGFECVRFAQGEGSLLSNESFVDTLERLNRAGIIFAEDFKQGWAPADLMRELQSTARLPDPFTSIAWRGTDHWFTTRHEPAGNV